MGRAAAGAQPQLKARLWVEYDGGIALSEAGADLLDQILACGSLSEAARRLGFSYRRSWMLVESMNARWPRPLVAKSTGGTGGGGSTVTEMGRAALGAYRELQVQIESVLGREAQTFRALIQAAIR